MTTIDIDLGKRSYPIYIGNGILSLAGKLFQSHCLSDHAGIITDTGVPPQYLRLVTSSLKQHGITAFSIIIPQGERQKSLLRAGAIYERLLLEGCTRSTTLVAVGGGVVGDVTGYVAATFRRGIPYVQVPTTLLGQVESSIGGKTGINLASQKNAVGAFHQPAFVLSDVATLPTLPRREIICGLGELFKYAYLTEELYAFVEEQFEAVYGLEPAIVEETLIRCNTMKSQMISEDERDELPSGGRMSLNLGHTIGHALEVLSNYKLHHGEAVLIGLQIELEIAQKAGIIDRMMAEKIETLIGKIRVKKGTGGISCRQVMNAIFGKHHTAKFILPTAFGEIIKVEIDRAIVQSVLKKAFPST